MTEQARAAYVGWLAPQITPNRRRNFDDLLALMHAKEFVFVVANDHNRVQDALDLREACFVEHDVKPYITTDVLGPVSVLEIMVALSKRLAFMTSAPPGEWAWALLCNLELDKYSGRIKRRWAEEIDEILDCLIWRQYEPNGQGGFFPLAWPRSDQRDVELWYQMSAFLAENEDPHEVTR